MNITFKQFEELLYKAYLECSGDLYKFWQILNPEAPGVQRIGKDKKIFLFCNKRKNKTTGEEFIKRVAKIDNTCYDFNFHTATVPKYHGFIVLKDYIQDDDKKQVIVYKYDFLTKENIKEDVGVPDELGF